MRAITEELLLEELRRLKQGLDAVETAMNETRVEMQRCLWEAHYGRERMDRSRRAYEARVAARRQRYQPIDKGPTSS